MFSKPKKIATLVLFCGYALAISLNSWATTVAATTCETFKKDVGDAQTASRNADIAAANDGFTKIQNLASQIKKACMDQIVAADVGSFGLGSIGTQILLNAASQVCDAAAQKANSYQQQATTAVNGKIDEVKNSLPEPVRKVATPGTTSSNGNVVSDTWLKLRQMIN